MANFKNDSKAKRYYWLKLKNDFFEQKEIKLLRRIAGGDTYTIIYLKMLLKSLKNDGALYYEAFGDNFAEEIALDIDENTEDVAMTISYLDSKGLIELVERDEYFLNKVPEMLGSESYSAERMRRLREKRASQCDSRTLQSDNNVPLCDEEIERRDREKSIQLEEEAEKDNNASSDSDLIPIFNFWEQNGFGMLPPLTMEHLEKWVEDFQEIGATRQDAIEIVLFSVHRGVEGNGKTYNYINTILKSWESSLFLTVTQIKAEDPFLNRQKKQERPKLSYEQYDDDEPYF